MNIRREEGVL